jgi:L-ribulokinase
MMGMEAGQSAFGDAYAWFKNVLAWPLQKLLPKSSLIDADTASKLVEEATQNIISELSKQAELLEPDENMELAIDWLNGRRTPDANQLLKGAIFGLNLGTDAPRFSGPLQRQPALVRKQL